MENLKVSDIIHHENKCWNNGLIEHLFDQQNVQEIKKKKKVPIIDLTMGDLRIWAANGEGLYSVKSAYKIIMTQVFYLSDFKIPRDWNCVWKLSVPPRMQTLIWRLARECLPTRANIKAKGVACSLLRPLCEIVVETAFRTFFACQTNIGCWNYADGALVVARTMWREPCMQARRRSMGNSTSA